LGRQSAVVSPPRRLAASRVRGLRRLRPQRAGRWLRPPLPAPAAPAPASCHLSRTLSRRPATARRRAMLRQAAPDARTGAVPDRRWRGLWRCDDRKPRNLDLEVSAAQATAALQTAGGWTVREAHAQGRLMAAVR